MIVFDLKCSKGHIFEGWFNDIRSFEEQHAMKMIACPYCNDTKVRKVLSPVATKTSSRTEEIKDKEEIDYKRLAKEVVNYINNHFEDVGTDFAKEALKIHYGVKEKRNIRGSATANEENTLKDEGIAFFKIPIPKTEDENKN